MPSLDLPYYLKPAPATPRQDIETMLESPTLPTLAFTLISKPSHTSTHFYSLFFTLFSILYFTFYSLLFTSLLYIDYEHETSKMHVLEYSWYIVTNNR